MPQLDKFTVLSEVVVSVFAFFVLLIINTSIVLPKLYRAKKLRFLFFNKLTTTGPAQTTLHFKKAILLYRAFFELPVNNGISSFEEFEKNCVVSIRAQLRQNSAFQQVKLELLNELFNLTIINKSIS